jgi:hypothetical protein
MEVDDELFNALAESGKLLLLLDAFDEVPDELKSVVLTTIEDLASSHTTLRILITSRPNQTVRASSHFLAVQLDNLKHDEYKNVINKMSADKTLAASLITHIEKRATHIKEMLCTPLLISLLVLSYKSYQVLPAKLSDFYDSLFQTLLQRHDGTKPGFVRHRRCNFDDVQYREVFEALCIFTKKRGQQSLSTQAILDDAKEALKHCNVSASANNFLEDIVQITCLILRDGEEYRFIHKTVQEYYTSSYVQKKPEQWAVKFYNQIHKYPSWSQELSFLSEIDGYRYNKYYLLPAILSFLNLDESDLDGKKKGHVLLDVDRMSGMTTVQFSRDDKVRAIGPVTQLLFWPPLIDIILPELNNLVAFNRDKGVESKEGDSTGIIEEEKHLHVRLSTILKHEKSKGLVGRLEQECRKMLDLAAEIRQTTSAQEDSSVLQGLL